MISRIILLPFKLLLVIAIIVSALVGCTTEQSVTTQIIECTTDADCASKNPGEIQ